jgi:anti-sigma factor RsiW
MTPHEQYAEDLALLAIGALDGADRELVESHLASCAACRFELQQLRRDAGLLALSAPVQRPPEAVQSPLVELGRARNYRGAACHDWLAVAKQHATGPGTQVNRR